MSSTHKAWLNMLHRSTTSPSNSKYPRPDRSCTGANPQTFVSGDIYPSAYVQFASSGFFIDAHVRGSADSKSHKKVR